MGEVKNLEKKKNKEEPEDLSSEFECKFKGIHAVSFLLATSNEGVEDKELVKDAAYLVWWLLNDIQDMLDRVKKGEVFV